MVLENTRYASNQTGVGEEWGEGECVAGGNTSILKMLQISTAFPRNHKHTFCLPAGLPPPHYTTRSCWVLHTVAWGGGGTGDPVREGTPLLPGQAAWCLHWQSWAVGTDMPQASSSTVGTHQARRAFRRSGVFMAPHFLPSSLVGGR